MISLEDEIAIYRFGQGVGPIDGLVEQYAQLAESDKHTWLFNLHILTRKVKYIDADVDQAIDSSGLDPDDPACVALTIHRWHASTLHMGDDDIDHHYALLLHLFKLAYQRHRASMNAITADWRYLDLSRNETVQGILTKHQTLAEEIYADPSFRSEFTSLAKLWYNKRLQGPVGIPYGSGRQINTEYVSYDDLITESVEYFATKNLYASALLHNSLRRGLAVRYKLEKEAALRISVEVVERHMIETYGTSLF